MSTRRGACPSLREPMATGDGLLVRLSPAGTGWAPGQLATLARAAALFGSGILEVTSRGNLQIRGLSEESAEALAGHVEDAAIPLRNGLPIDVGPLAGIDAHEIADPLPIARQLGDAVERTGLSARLGPKISVVIDGGGALTMDAVIGDIRLTPRQAGHWSIAIGGTARTARVLGSVDTTDAVPAAIRLLEAIAAKGNAARGRDLSDEELAALSDCPALRRHHASQGTGDWLRSRPLHLQGREVPSEARRRGGLPVGQFALRDSTFAAGFALPFGQVEAATLAEFCTAAENAGASEIRPARGRGLVVPGLDAATCLQLADTALKLGLITEAADPRLSIAACAGVPFCASAHFATRALGADIAARAPELLAGRSLHLSGCGKRCAEPPAPDFTLLGTPLGCEVLAGRGHDAAPSAVVAPENVLAMLRQMAEVDTSENNRPARTPQPAHD